MRQQIPAQLEQIRTAHPTLGPTPRGNHYGYFVHNGLRIISTGVNELMGWEHVSVSLYNRLPTWDEMCLVKSLFWDEEETVIQFHPKKSQYVNQHPFCLHLWKKIGVDAELPNIAMV